MTFGCCATGRPGCHSQGPQLARRARRAGAARCWGICCWFALRHNCCELGEPPICHHSYCSSQYAWARCRRALSRLAAAASWGNMPCRVLPSSSPRSSRRSACPIGAQAQRPGERSTPAPPDAHKLKTCGGAAGVMASCTRPGTSSGAPRCAGGRVSLLASACRLLSFGWTSPGPIQQAERGRGAWEGPQGELEALSRQLPAAFFWSFFSRIEVPKCILHHGF